MSGRRILAVSALVLVFVVMLGILSTFLIDFGFLKPKIEQLVNEATGRELRIEGDLSVKILPRPKILFEQATLTGPAWSDDASMLEVAHAKLEIYFWSILFRPVVVREFTLRDVQIIVENNASGDLNWRMGNAAPEPAAQEDPAPGIDQQTSKTGDWESPLAIHSAAIDNIKVIYRQPSADELLFSLDSLAIAKQDSFTELQAKAHIDSLPLSIVAAITHNRTDLDIKLNETELTTQYDYSWDGIKFLVAVNKLSELGRVFEYNGLPKEKLNLSGFVTIEDEKVLLQEFVATLSGFKVALDATIDSSDASSSVSIMVTGDELNYLSSGLPAIPFVGEAKITAVKDQIEIKPLSVRVGSSDMIAEALIQTKGVPTIKVGVQSDKIDLSPFAKEPSPQSTKNETQELERAPPAQYVFEDSALPFEALKSVDLDINADIKLLTLKNTEIRQVTLASNLQQGNLQLNGGFTGKLGGELLASLDLQNAGNDSQIKLETSLQDFKISVLSGADVPSDQVPKTNLTARLTAQGATPRALASSLDGHILLRQGPGKVSNDLIESFSGDILSQLLNALNPFAKDEEFTQWDCSILALDLVSGLGDVSGFLLQSEKLMVVGGGDVNLNDETLNFEFNTKPRKGVGISADMFVTPFVKLTGTLAQPSVGLNKKGVLLSGGAAVLTGGMSFLYTGLMDRATAEGDRCQKLLDKIQQELAPQSNEK